MKESMKNITGIVPGILWTATAVIEVGKIADLVVLDRDLFAVLPGQIKSSRPTAVLMEGKLINGSLP
jgi:urease alpha subunit